MAQTTAVSNNFSWSQRGSSHRSSTVFGAVAYIHTVRPTLSTLPYSALPSVIILVKKSTGARKIRCKCACSQLLVDTVKSMDVLQCTSAEYTDNKHEQLVALKNTRNIEHKCLLYIHCIQMPKH